MRKLDRTAALATSAASTSRGVRLLAASVMPVIALVSPGPWCTDRIPGRPVPRAQASAAHAAPHSCLAATNRAPLAIRAFVTWKLPLPTSPNTVSAPRLARVAPTASLTCISRGQLPARSTRASARHGLPEPPVIGSGVTISTTPVGGSCARFCSWVRPYLPAPSIAEWHGNGGSNECARPASVPTVSTPIPMTGDSSASHREHSTERPGVCGPVSLAFRNRSWSWERSSQPVRNSSQPPSGSGPWVPSQALMCSTSSRKSGSAAAWALKSSTTAGAISLPGATWDTSSPSRPVTQWHGASKCVPVCSPVVMSFQYQAGPRSSNRLISCRAKDTVLLNGGGSLSTGVDEDSGAVRSMTSTVALASASESALSTDMGGSCPSVVLNSAGPCGGAYQGPARWRQPCGVGSQRPRASPASATSCCG